MRKMFTTLVVAAVAALSVGGVAYAQNPTQDAYTGVLGQQTASTKPGAASGAGGNLPFTGFETGIVAAIGLGLLGTGLALRRTSRADSDS